MYIIVYKVIWRDYKLLGAIGSGAFGKVLVV